MREHDARPSSQALNRTPLHGLHMALSARMVPYAGYEMPVHFALGVLKEHLHTRAAAGLFDVSHMGQIMLRPKSGGVGDVARALEQLIPVDIVGLLRGRQRYGFFTNDRGGILDDLMIANRGNHILLVVNAARKQADEAHLRSQLACDCDVVILDRALIALQGPKSEEALGFLAPDCASMRFMDVREMPIMGAASVVARSGYCGEDGFEISAPADVAREIAEGLLERPYVLPIGLGARDSLRLEAGLPLYGSDIDATTTPVEAGLAWAIQGSRRPGGDRSGEFPGFGVIIDQIGKGPPRRRVGLRPQGRAPVRAGALLFKDLDGGQSVGSVTSGGYGPSVNAPVAMGYVPTEMAVPGTRIFAEVRGNRLPVEIATLPFIAHRYKRG